MESDRGPTNEMARHPSGTSPEGEASSVGGDDDRRGGYLGFVAHEVRNPLSTALWSAELLARMPPADRGGARGDKLTAMCLRSLGRVRQLVEDHFMCERLDVAGLPVRPEPVDVREVLEVVATRRPPGATAPELHVEGGVSVDADRTLLDRALDALVAIASRENTPVRVDGALHGGRLRLVFTGHPASDEVLEDPRKGSPGEPRGRALAGPLARRAARALGAELTVDAGALVLTLSGAAYTARAS